MPKAQSSPQSSRPALRRNQARPPRPAPQFLLISHIFPTAQACLSCRKRKLVRALPPRLLRSASDHGLSKEMRRRSPALHHLRKVRPSMPIRATVVPLSRRSLYLTGSGKLRLVSPLRSVLRQSPGPPSASTVPRLRNLQSPHRATMHVRSCRWSPSGARHWTLRKDQSA
jgi:hypothetical protein